MKNKALWTLCLLARIGACVWVGDWPSAGGNPQRDGWLQGEKDLSKENLTANKVELLYKFKFDGNDAKGLTDMSQPIVLTGFYGYNGYKQPLFVGGSSDIVYSFDVDTARP